MTGNASSSLFYLLLLTASLLLAGCEASESDGESVPVKEFHTELNKAAEESLVGLQKTLELLEKGNECTKSTGTAIGMLTPIIIEGPVSNTTAPGDGITEMQLLAKDLEKTNADLAALSRRVLALQPPAECEECATQQNSLRESLTAATNDLAKAKDALVFAADLATVHNEEIKGLEALPKLGSEVFIEQLIAYDVGELQVYRNTLSKWQALATPVTLSVHRDKLVTSAQKKIDATQRHLDNVESINQSLLLDISTQQANAGLEDDKTFTEAYTAAKNEITGAEKSVRNNKAIVEEIRNQTS